MKFNIENSSLLKVLKLLVGIVQRRQTLPILGNVLVKAQEGSIVLITTDLEIELIMSVPCEVIKTGEVTIPARKWLDICQNLSDGSQLKIDLKNERITIQSGKSRFTLSTLPASEFPRFDDITVKNQFTISKKQLKSVFEATHFAMAQQDVRYYLNGLMLEISADQLRAVATDGHRLAIKDTSLSLKVDEGNNQEKQIIIPRKAIQELMRILSEEGDEVSVEISPEYIRLRVNEEDITFTSKLIDGRFPDYQRVIPEKQDNFMLADRDLLRQTLSRVAILSNEKYRGIKMVLQADNLQVMANNPEQEEAQDELSVEYSGDQFEIGFNATYLLDSIMAIPNPKVQLTLVDSNSSCLIQSVDDPSAKYVIMPMRL